MQAAELPPRSRLQQACRARDQTWHGPQHSHLQFSFCVGCERRNSAAAAATVPAQSPRFGSRRMHDCSSERGVPCVNRPRAADGIRPAGLAVAFALMRMRATCGQSMRDERSGDWPCCPDPCVQASSGRPRGCGACGRHAYLHACLPEHRVSGRARHRGRERQGLQGRRRAHQRLCCGRSGGVSALAEYMSGDACGLDGRGLGEELLQGDAVGKRHAVFAEAEVRNREVGQQRQQRLAEEWRRGAEAILRARHRRAPPRRVSEVLASLPALHHPRGAVTQPCRTCHRPPRRCAFPGLRLTGRMPCMARTCVSMACAARGGGITPRGETVLYGAAPGGFVRTVRACGLPRDGPWHKWCWDKVKVERRAQGWGARMVWESLRVEGGGRPVAEAQTQAAWLRCPGSARWRRSGPGPRA